MNENTRISSGFYDGSIWETAKRTSDESLKNLIREGIKNTSVTCVLAGTNTYQRRWVRYEIARSVIKGNGLICLKIHNLENQKGQVSYAGPNPLAFMGVYRDQHGGVYLAENIDGRWCKYSDYTLEVALPMNWREPSHNQVIQLCDYAQEYSYNPHFPCGFLN